MIMELSIRDISKHVYFNSDFVLILVVGNSYVLTDVTTLDTNNLSLNLILVHAETHGIM